MTGPARPSQSARERPYSRSDGRIGAHDTFLAKRDADTGVEPDGSDEEGLVIDLTGLTDISADTVAASPSATERLQVQDQHADGPDMAETETTPREAGVSFPMTTTAQVELRDAIRERTQANLDALRARRTA